MSTGNLYTPTINGDYQARLTSIYGCKYYTNIYSYNSVDVFSKNEDYLIYPNPAQDEITLFWPGPKKLLHNSNLDLNGKLVKNEKAIALRKEYSIIILKMEFTLFI